ncbi:MAG: hybrid sensor histidine kinase/response regulator [Cyanobacteriota bacterium]
MTNDPSIREQSYRYFLQEAPELLQVLEQELLSLREGYSINKIHTLMRTTHTLKGASASVGLETIKTVSHSLEDIFKALFNPDLSIDAEVEALLFEGYECLRLAMSAELTGGQINHTEILDRTAAVFAQLQEKLGDCFGSEARIPSSVELGFDVTQSIFEVGVNQRLEELASAIASADAVAMATTLRTQSEVFVGLAESLNLAGFGAIAQAAIAALDNHPEDAVTIAQTALADFREGQAAVLQGDRTQGGQPSVALQQLAGFTPSSTELPQAVKSSNQQIDDLTAAKTTSSQQQSVTRIEGIPITHTPDSESSESQSQDEDVVNLLLESIWGGETAADEESEQTQEIGSEQDEEPVEFFSTPNFTTASAQEPEVTVETPIFGQFRSDREPTPISQKDSGSQFSTVRVNVENLEHLNYSIGELLTNQNLQSLQNEQIQTSVRVLLNRLKQQQQLLGQLQDWSDRLFVDAEKRRIGELSVFSKNKGLWGTRSFQEVGIRGVGNTVLNSQSSSANPQAPSQQGFDSLELDRYSEAQLVVQTILENAVQLAEASEAIELFAAQSTQTLDKQRRLLTGTRDSLMEARMLPLGELFSRFPRVLKQLEALHDKLVALKVLGTDVLVDKVIAEKLYGPLLHLVRNAFDHGIESPSMRRQLGKPDQGHIEIHAYYRGKSLVIEIRDDGRGLNFDAIRQRALDLQLISVQQANTFSENQLTDLLFQPGFSTTAQVNDLSGRGIGLDIVRVQAESLQGSVSVHSQPYKGTTFVLEIPLSLTIAKLLVTQAGNRIYALLSDAIEQIFIPQAHQIRSWEGGKVLQWGQGKDERLIPIHQLSNVLDYFSQLPEIFVSAPRRPVITQGQAMPIILIRSEDRLLGLEVDQLIGEQELVIRPLGTALAPPDYVYGGSIMADGRLTLVIDGAALIQYLSDQQMDGITNSALESSVSPLLPSSQQQRQLPTQVRAALPASPESNIRARGNRTVLLVDDSITLRQTLALTLQKAGYQVVQAKDGYEAIERLQRQPGIQLVLCDIEMPRMNGFEFLKYRQQDPSLAVIPVVILTSRSGEKHRLIASELGATDYITKPFLEHMLLATLSEVIEKSTHNSVSR